MVASFIVFLISVVAKISVDLGKGTFPFLEKVSPYAGYVVIACGIIFFVFVIVKIVKAIKK